MKEYDVIVVGSGSAMIIAEEAVAHGLKVALVDRGPLGGTCANLGCIPSKLLIYPADRIVEVQEAGKFGVEVELKSVDFPAVMNRMRQSLAENLSQMKHDMKHSHGLDYYEGEGHFTADYTLEVNGKAIKGKHVFIGAGSRPLIPPIKGLDTVDYLTNETLLQLTEKPASLIIVGGGYIAVEYGHFFAAMGTKVTIIEMADRLLAAEEPEISALLKDELSRRMGVFTNVQAQEVRQGGDGVIVIVKDRLTGQESQHTAQHILVAVGRKSNADTLNLDKTGVQVDERGYIKVNEYLESNKENILAIGDVNGQQMFTHMANRQAMTAAHNVLHQARMKTDFTMPPPHAVFSHPQIASVGFTEERAKKDHQVLVSRVDYANIAGGEAMLETRGFAKAIAEKDTEKILGFHIAGPYAAILIQEVINAMATEGHIDHIRAGAHIHPALSELVTRTLGAFGE